jgi:hypothetical protein
VIEIVTISSSFRGLIDSIMVTFSLDDSGNDVDADRYNIEESFGALDVHKTGRLGFDLAYTLLLGLGYLGNYKKKNDFTPGILKQLTKKIENDVLLKDGSSNSNNNNDEGVELGIKLETLLTIVATVRTSSFFKLKNVHSVILVAIL